MGRKVIRTEGGFCVVETVSKEQERVTPIFATRQELADHLATEGDSFDRYRGDGPWDPDCARRFVFEIEDLPTMMVIDLQCVLARDLPRHLPRKEGK